MRYALLSLLLSGLLAGCNPDVPTFQSPAQTYRIYTDAISANQPQQVWACLSAGYRELAYGSDLQRWLDAWAQEQIERGEAVKRLQVRDEILINEDLGYLQFDDSTVLPGESPFSYFLREGGEWKITTHLDPAFRQALEQAVSTGDYLLPLAQ